MIILTFYVNHTLTTILKKQNSDGLSVKHLGHHPQSYDNSYISRSTPLKIIILTHYVSNTMATTLKIISILTLEVFFTLAITLKAITILMFSMLHTLATPPQW